ncbi:Y-family DNA polymerase [Wenzhouxiangella marina]|uniref:Uncharacterized protein n=1 Tax=Wenzhouxiangella marina TaxID=1579979 RepID=A0A0K0XWV4_9GAMM|nr:DNA polymerase Y family protein [Wenzhouxiangella marina]AKS42150.1 hypothetical protein WM2015_1783 [Wenzhouxiangella marina]MBB6086078.1 protein ImuB [Wenzhouxiangella marina]
MPSSRLTLWAGLHCPRLPLDAVWRWEAQDGPIAVHEHVRGQARILQADAQARRHGVRPGQGLSQALALLPSLPSRPRCRQSEQRALEQIALVAYQHSHQVSLAPPDTVLLEVGGSRRLHGGIAPLLDQLADTLSEQGFSIRIGLAPVPTAACLMARLGRRCSKLETLRHELPGLPIDVLPLSAEQSRALEACGLRTLEELYALPAAQRARRFGTGLNLYLDRLEGRLDTPLAQWKPPERFELGLELPVATHDRQALMFIFKRALDSLGHWLELRDQRLTRLHACLGREDGGPDCRFDIGLARPAFDRARMLELIELKLEALQLGGDIDSLRLRAESTSEHRPAQADLLGGGNRSDAWPALLDRLGARLGEDGLASLAPRSDHRPEQSWQWVAPGTSRPCQETRPRPSWLLPAPQPCQRERLVLEEGPERIEAGWWDGQDCKRDYWIARDRQGRRLWVFREHSPRSGWFIHGLFG